METWRQDLARVILAGAVLGITAGAVVWFLERFETARFHDEMRSYMEKWDAFKTWDATHGDGATT